ncbi:MAG: NifB/NifX family molybdenum-iron cluster-binding protein [Candidatus Nealsonbacteria bacterium]
MKICISATGNNLDTPLDPRFGRAVYFLIVDDKGELIKVIKNTGVQAMRGAGVTAAEIVAKEKVKVVITGNIGPNASLALSSSGIKVFLSSPAMSVRDAVTEYQKGKLKETTEAVPCRPASRPRFDQRKRFRNKRRGKR